MGQQAITLVAICHFCNNKNNKNNSSTIQPFLPAQSGRFVEKTQIFDFVFPPTPRRPRIPIALRFQKGQCPQHIPANLRPPPPGFGLPPPTATVSSKTKVLIYPFNWVGANLLNCMYLDRNFKLGDPRRGAPCSPATLS